MNLRGAVCLAVFGAAVLPVFGADLPWAKSWADAQAKSAATGKLIMVDFFTTWCGPCKQMKATTFKDASVIKAATGIIPLGLDAEKEGKALAAKYKVMSYPTIIFMDSKGNVFRRIETAMAAAPFKSAVTGVIEMYADRKKAADAYRKNPKDVKTVAKLAMIDAGRGEIGLAERFANEALKLGAKSGDVVDAWLLLGDAKRGATNFLGGMAAYLKVLSLTADGVQKSFAYLGMAACYYGRGDMGQARTYAQMVLATKGGDEGAKANARRLLAQL